MEYAEAVERYSELIWRICRVRLCGAMTEDASDAYQDTFLRYYSYVGRGGSFNDENHRKAWLIRAAVSSCEDIRRKRKTRRVLPIDELSIPDENEERDIESVGDDTVLGALLGLPEKYRTVVQLYYCEGLSCDEIASALHLGGSAVRMRLKRGREKLAKAIGNQN